MSDERAGRERDGRLVGAPEAFDFGPEPTWRTCACGERSTRVPCLRCTLDAEARADRARIAAEGEQSIPAEFAWATVRSPELAARVKSLRTPLRSMIASILGAHQVVLAGGSGAGKTSVAIACLRERLAVGARFVSAIELGTARIQHRAGDGDALAVERAVAVPLLLIDDLGEEQHTATNAVRDVIRLRHMAGRPTWVTTGLRSHELGAVYGDGIKRRLLEAAYAEWLGPAPEGDVQRWAFRGAAPGGDARRVGDAD